MSIITDLTRDWLTRSLRPFTFTPSYDEELPYEDCSNLGLYIHIPFCRSICSFCPYCKTVYRKETCDRYIDALLKEIRNVGSAYQGRKEVTSLYFGGGTPALAHARLKEIIDEVNRHFIITDGIGLELHPDDVREPVLRELKEAGVTRISIGIQSFHDKYQDILGRRSVDVNAMKQALEAVPFETVSMDLIFALPSQTLYELEEDIETAFNHGANHVAVYPFIDFTFTDSRVKAMPKNEKHRLLDGITNYCLAKGYERTSIWTFAKEKNAVYSSMTRESFLGFGCSAATLLRDQFKINTFSVDEYCRRIDEGKLPTSLTIRFTRRQRMVYWLFWTLYSTHLDPEDFKRFFGVSLDQMYGTEFILAQMLGFLKKEQGIYHMTLRGAFYYHYYENYYTLAYIDKMWGIMRLEAFPERIEL
ncbi:MAG: radical SAM protein [Solobacterium sp.]|nr:radical SAM protein [Solobacterium sp.]